MSYGVSVQLQGMPCHIKAVTFQNDDDTYTIVLNSILDNKELQNIYRHEMFHIEHANFENKELGIKSS